jgi:hypothetical protein
VLTYLNKVSRFSVDKELNNLRQQLANFTKETELGTVQFKLNEVTVSEVTALRDKLAIYVDLSGDARFRFIFKQQVVPVAAVGVNSANSTTGDASDGMPPAIIKEDIQQWGPHMKLPIYDIGDTIWYQSSEGAVKYRLAELKDKNFEGDTLRIMDNAGKMKYHILTSDDLKKKMQSN